MEIILILFVIYIVGVFFEKSDYHKMKEASKLPPFTEKECWYYYKQMKEDNE